MVKHYKETNISSSAPKNCNKNAPPHCTLMKDRPPDIRSNFFSIHTNLPPVLICAFIKLFQKIYLNLYKEYTSLKPKELEELPCFRVMIWQPYHLLRFAMNCFSSNSFLYCKNNQSYRFSNYVMRKNRNYKIIYLYVFIRP